MRLYDRINNNQTYVIAEMSGNHAGKLQNALDIVHEAKKAGADCLKIQTFKADSLTLDCDNEYFVLQTGLWKGKKRYDVYKETEMPWEWTEVIQKECEACGLDFLSTPFDKESVDFLESRQVEFYKIASFELVDIPLIRYVASKQKPIILSCGLGSAEEIREALDAIYKEGNRQVVLLKCCSEYPAPFEDMNLKTICDMKERFDVPVGLSDHSLGSVAATTAVAIGAQVIEKHFCLSRTIENPDAKFSMEPAEFKAMVDTIRNVEVLLGKATYERSVTEEQRMVSRRSLFAVKDICVGDVFSEENVRSIRPSFGLKPIYYEQLFGKTSKRVIKRGEPILYEDLG